MSAVTGTEAPAGVSVGQPTGPEVPLVSDGYRRYALVMLLIVYTINFLDRQIVSILAEPIKNDLQISDTQLGLLTGVFASISSWAGGAIADKFGGRDLRAYGSVPAIASLAAVPFYIAAMLSPSALFALLLLIPVNLLGSLWYGPVYASAQGLVPPQMRATSAAVVLFIINMVGLGLGALTVGAFSDFYNYGLGLGAGDGVRWALISTALFNVIAAALFWMARRRIREEMVS